MSITWNGVSSDTIGVVVERIPNRYVPTRRFSPQQVAGRNGNILLVDKSFPNVEQEYEVYLSAEAQGLPSVARACAEWLMGPTGYCRLQDSYDTTVYREAFLMGGYDLENILNKFGRCTITFSCKPQKYLLTGDTPISIPAGATTTYTGSSVQFDGITGASITSLSTTITPTQDLHGYANPWPAGGGKNKLNPLATYKGCSYNAAVGTTLNPVAADKSWQDAGNDTFTISNLGSWSQACLISDPLPLGKAYVKISNVIGTLKCSIYVCNGDFKVNRVSYNRNPVPEGDTIVVNTTFTNDDTYFVVYLSGNGADASIQYPYVYSGDTAATDSFSPYSNICPISGRTGLSVYRTGKNLVDPSKKEIATGSTTTARWYNDGTGFLLHGGQAYAISSNISTDATYFVYFYDMGGTQLAYGKWTATYTPSADTYVYFQYYESGGANLSDAELQLELGSATTYEPYKGNTYAVDWTTQAGTVYGGTLDVVTGELVVDRGRVNVSSSWYWNKSSSYPGGFYVDIQNAGTGQKKNTPFICSHAKTATSTSKYVKGTCFCDASINIRIMDGSDTVQDWKDYINAQITAGTPIQICYELATPLTYQLTAQEIEALVGTNNIWTSSGPVSVTVATPLSGTVTNPTPFEARPLLEVSGVGEITINGKSIQILESVSDFQIDCEAMEAEVNSKIYCMDFPELSGGENEIVGDASITALTVTPRWWTL